MSPSLTRDGMVFKLGQYLTRVIWQRALFIPISSHQPDAPARFV